MKRLGIFNILWAFWLIFWFFLAMGLGGVSAPTILIPPTALLISIISVISGIYILKRNARMCIVILRGDVCLIALVLLIALPYGHMETLNLFNGDFWSLIFYVGMILAPLISNLIILTRPKVKEQFK